MLPKNKDLTAFSQKLRKEMTKEEKHIGYDFLRCYPIQFRRQKVIGSYIVDFYSDKAKLVIEIDGSQHDEDDALVYDAKRTLYLNSLGIGVIRFTNADINKGFENVCFEIHNKICELYPSSEVINYDIQKWEGYPHPPQKRHLPQGEG